MNTMDQIKVRYGGEGKLVPIKKFLKAKNLSGIAKKIQDSLSDLYRLNGENDPPLFHFPDFPKDTPLIIDCTTPTYDDCTAHYKPGEHIIEFVKNLHDIPHLDNCSFTECLAHELTHAEQDVDEINDLAKENGYRYHQLRLLMEAQAFVKGRKIRRMLEGEKWYASDNERIHDVELEIERLRGDSYYRNRWARYFPVKEEDTPITFIPAAFHLSNNLLSSIYDFPIDAAYPEFKGMDEIRKHPERVYTYFARETDNKKRVTSADKLFDKILFNENITSETILDDLEMLDFLLNLTDSEGRTIFREKELMERFVYKEAEEGIGESKLLQVAELATDAEGKKIFPENFSKKAKGMTLSEFSEYIRHYLDIVDPVLDLDHALPETAQPNTSDKKEPEKKSMTDQLQSCAHVEDLDHRVRSDAYPSQPGSEQPLTPLPGLLSQMPRSTPVAIITGTEQINPPTQRIEPCDGISSRLKRLGDKGQEDLLPQESSKKSSSKREIKRIRNDKTPGME